MKSEWKVTSQMIGDAKMYAAYRLRDKDKPDHSGNREYAGQYVEDREVLAAAVKALNEMEVQE
ncbi:hypothetical protein KCG48_05085 [Proteiniclasticum sp. BAD-10]|uniref:Uncharacterized protein n=1 Tax=Proteiniclasticum sediminis TaxID=2804028 RepID=A0A941CNA1_9CLOT|nr:hypothetical protein [Proteiniclasticum sediminis]MBR0575715.1 hypothetical protein [Proteiniclasticum sediminis]